jgi:hypothetical protein
MRERSGVSRLNDAELSDLLRLAAEADALAGPSLLHADAGAARPTPGLRRWSRAVGGVAAAGLLAAAGAAIWLRPGTAPAPLNAPIARGVIGDPGVAPVSLVPAGECAPDPAHTSVVVALFKDADGRCRCVVTRGGEEFGERAAASLSPGELLTMALSELCSPEVSRIVVIGLSGPAERLPLTAADAQALAACVEAGSGDGLQASCLGWACVPDGVSVSTASLALGVER